MSTKSIAKRHASTCTKRIRRESQAVTATSNNGGSPTFRAMLNADVRFLDCDDDTLAYVEMLGFCEQKWNATSKGEHTNVSVVDLQEGLEREYELGYHPADLYTKQTFTTIIRLMEKEGLSTTDLSVFLRWKAKADSVGKARGAKAKKRRKVGSTEKGRSFLMYKRLKHSMEL